MRRKRVLFIQATEPAAYPPLIHASTLMADAGWDVSFLAAPSQDIDLVLTPYPHITLRAIKARPSYVMTKAAYAAYVAMAVRLVLEQRPDLVYASNPLGAGPGLLAARLGGAALLYHEHDSPEPESLPPLLSYWRCAAARAAKLLVFPNEGRAQAAQTELGFRSERLRIVWNMPRQTELLPLVTVPPEPLLLYYHGSITPDRLPLTVIDAIRQMGGRVRLRIAGYEAPGAGGYASALVARGNVPGMSSLVEYIGQVQSRDELMRKAAHAHIGLAFMPRRSGDINMSHMTGASNKAFDYMASGLALLVSDLPDWTQMFVAPGYGRSCDIGNTQSLADAFGWYLTHAPERATIAARNRAKIAADWTYEKAFAPVLTAVSV